MMLRLTTGLGLALALGLGSRLSCKCEWVAIRSDPIRSSATSQPHPRDPTSHRRMGAVAVAVAVAVTAQRELTTHNSLGERPRKNEDDTQIVAEISL